MKITDKHEFALYFSGLSSTMTAVKINQEISMDDEALCHRVVKVLRLSVQETVTLFDEHQHAQLLITDIQKRSIRLRLISKEKNVTHAPAITFIVPLLKRADLETALYSLVEIGINTIQLVSTQKTAKDFYSDKEFNRLHNVMIAAAEQSKNFAMPTLKNPLSLRDVLAQIPTTSPFIYFDPTGQPLIKTISALQSVQPSEIFLMVGPEGDLTMDEKELIKNHKAQFCALTPTILRAAQAIAVGAGIMRSTL